MEKKLGTFLNQVKDAIHRSLDNNVLLVKRVFKFFICVMTYDSIVTYFMTLLPIPCKVLKQLDKIRRNFL